MDPRESLVAFFCPFVAIIYILAHWEMKISGQQEFSVKTGGKN